VRTTGAAYLPPSRSTSLVRALRVNEHVDASSHHNQQQKTRARRKKIKAKKASKTPDVTNSKASYLEALISSSSSEPHSLHIFKRHAMKQAKQPEQ
jgi:hypothetical protein